MTRFALMLAEAAVVALGLAWVAFRTLLVLWPLWLLGCLGWAAWRSL